MSLDLVFQLHCDRCDEVSTETFYTKLEAEQWAIDNGWENAPDDEHVCSDCADEVEEAEE